VLKRLLDRVIGRVRVQAAIPADFVRIRDVSSFLPILDRIEREASDDGDLRARLARVRLESPELERLSSLDPFSSAYRDELLALYERLFGRRHDVVREGMTYDIEHELRHPFPFAQGSAFITGSYIVAYGFLIRVLGLAPGSRILEVGCGSGALTWFLARVGYRVTALEINPSGAELTRRYCAGIDPAPRVEAVAYEAFDPGEERYDAVVFFESFHHMLDPVDALHRCTSLIAPGGVVALAAEPIVPAGSPIVPYPWGLRTDGESLRAMAKFGWIELGFQEPYLAELVRRGGWRAEPCGIADNPWAQVRLLRRN